MGIAVWGLFGSCSPVFVFPFGMIFIGVMEIGNPTTQPTKQNLQTPFWNQTPGFKNRYIYIYNINNNDDVNKNKKKKKTRAHPSGRVHIASLPRGLVAIGGGARQK